MKKFSFLLILGLLLCLFQPLIADIPALKTVTAEGVGSLSDSGDRGKARDEALTDAQRRAVEIAVGLFIDSQTLVENSQVIEDKIYANSKGYIKTYEVISENEAGNMYRVQIKAQVWLGEISKDLGGVWDKLKLASAPRFLVMIGGENPGNDNSAETTIINRLSALGIRIVDPEQLKTVKSKREAKLSIEGNLEAIRTLGNQYDAEIVIAGKSSVREVKSEILKNSELYSFDGRVNASAVLADRAEIISADKGKAPQPQVDISTEGAVEKALEAAANDWADKNLSRIVQAVLDPTQNYEIIVSNARDYSKISQLDDALQEIRFVRQTSLRDFNAPVAKLEVDSLGSVKQLAASLSTLKGVKLEIKDITAKSIRVELKS